MVALAMALSTSAAADTAPDRCHARLSLKLTPDVPNPRDPSFLSALTADPLYEITWVNGQDSAVVVDLYGPATDYHCEQEINRLGRNGSILELQVLQQDTGAGSR